MKIETFCDPCHKEGFEEFVTNRIKEDVFCPDFLPKEILGKEVLSDDCLKRATNSLVYLWIEGGAKMWFDIDQVNEGFIIGHAWAFDEWVQAILTTKSVKKFLCMPIA